VLKPIKEVSEAIRILPGSPEQAAGIFLGNPLQ
jgi:hypothetical protein